MVKTQKGLKISITKIKYYFLSIYIRVLRDIFKKCVKMVK